MSRSSAQTPDLGANVLTPEEVFANPGYLKLELMRHGLRLAPCLGQELHEPRGAHGVFGKVGDLDLVLPKNTWVSVPVSSTRASKSPYELVATEGGHALRWAPVGTSTVEPRADVTVHQTSAFYRHTTSAGLPYSRLGTVHGSYLALSPSTECEFLGSRDQCHFCSLTVDTSGKPRVPVEDVVEAIRVARQLQDRIDMVYLSIGYVEGDDAGVRVLEPYIRAIKKAFDVLVAVDALPPSANAWIDRTYAMGVDSVSYNLEIFDADRFAAVCPGPARAIGRSRYLDALEYATTVFPAGAVLCHLIVGLEPLASTQAGIETLVERRVVPVLPIYRPFKGRDMREDPGARAPSTRELSELYALLYRRLRKERLPMSWVRNISVVTTPAEGRLFVSEASGLPGLLSRLVGGPRRPSVTLSDWRRSLRVKEVDDSLKSSGL